MNARSSLIGCLLLLILSILVQPASVRFGIYNDVAAATSHLALLCGIGAAFMAVSLEMKSDGKWPIRKKP